MGKGVVVGVADSGLGRYLAPAAGDSLSCNPYHSGSMSNEVD
jgi:hypothetical protein